MNVPTRPVKGIDGVTRGPKTEQVINDLCLEVFGKNELGRKVFDYLRSITTETASSGNALDTNQLWHLEGQRWLVGVLSRRIKQGEEQRKAAAFTGSNHE